MSEPTKERLARTLREAGLEDLAQRAAAGEFDDYESPHAMPQLELILELGKRDQTELIDRVSEGEFDGTLEESQAWFEREGKDLLR